MTAAATTLTGGSAAQITRLEDHVDILSGFAFDSKLFSDSKGTPLIRIRDVVRGRTETNFSGAYDKKFLIKRGDLLVGMDGDFNRAIWASEPALLNQRVCKITARSESLDQRYLYHFLPMPLMEIWHQTPFATVKHLSVKGIKSIEIPLPPLDEQRRIAAILDKADELRTKRREALAHLDTLTQSIFHFMFGNVVRNQRGWSIEAFDQVTTSRLGKMLDKKVQTGNFRFKYLRNANVQWFRIETHDLLEMDFSPADQLEFSLQYGDVLICEGGEPGRAAIWRDEVQHCYFQKALHRARPNPKRLTSEYLVQLLWVLAKGGGLDDHVTVATIAHLTGEKLKRMRIPVPPLELQQTFATRVAAVERLKELHRKHLAELDALFASLQHRAFKGEL